MHNITHYTQKPREDFTSVTFAKETSMTGFHKVKVKILQDKWMHSFIVCTAVIITKKKNWNRLIICRTDWKTISLKLGWKTIAGIHATVQAVRVYFQIAINLNASIFPVCLWVQCMCDYICLNLHLWPGFRITLHCTEADIPRALDLWFFLEGSTWAWVRHLTLQGYKLHTRRFKSLYLSLQLQESQGVVGHFTYASILLKKNMLWMCNAFRNTISWLVEVRSHTSCIELKFSEDLQLLIIGR